MYACAGFLNVILGTYGVDIFGMNFADTEHILAENFVLFAIIVVGYGDRSTSSGPTCWR